MFSAHRSTKRYCSANCRLHAYRQRVPSIADIRNRLDRELERAHRSASLSRWRSGFVFIPSAARHHEWRPMAEVETRFAVFFGKVDQKRESGWYWTLDRVSL